MVRRFQRSHLYATMRGTTLRTRGLLAFFVTTMLLGVGVMTASARRLNPFSGIVSIPSGERVALEMVTVSGVDDAVRMLQNEVLCRRYEEKAPLELRLKFKKPQRLTGLQFRAYMGDSIAVASEHGRIATLTVSTDAGTTDIQFVDPVNLPTSYSKHDPLEMVRATSSVVLGRPTEGHNTFEPVVTKTLSVKVSAVHAGTKFADVCIGAVVPFAIH